MNNETFYFSHDYDARNDPKIVKLFRIMGFEGKGIYWDLIETLYQQGGYINVKEIEDYAFAMRTECERIEKVLTEFNLFSNDGDKYWSESVLRRLNLRYEKSEKAKQSAKSRWEKTKPDANALQSQSEGNAIKEKKLKDIKINNGQSPDFFVRVEKFIAMFNGLRGTKYKPISDVQTALETQLLTYTPEQIQYALKNAIKDKYHIDNNYKSLTPKYLLQTDILERYVNIKQIPKELPAPGSFKIDHSSMNEQWNKNKESAK